MGQGAGMGGAPPGPGLSRRAGLVGPQGGQGWDAGLQSPSWYRLGEADTGSV